MRGLWPAVPEDDSQGVPDQSFDEVLGLHPVPDIDSAALKRQPDLESLALSCRAERAAVPGDHEAAPSFSTYICLGRVAAAYPAGLASEVITFVRAMDPKGTPQSCNSILAARIAKYR